MLTLMTLLTACSTLGTGTKSNATDSALCEVLEGPVDEAVSTTLEYAGSTPPQVVNKWFVVVKGFDAGCT